MVLVNIGDVLRRREFIVTRTCFAHKSRMIFGNWRSHLGMAGFSENRTRS
jgi:hypothetical protein